ncbi:MAG: hypothetical protein F6K44_11440 [Moorea sp. SIO3E2]|nr:hypothetical protein [Moorena sp. SIO3E2]
MILLPIPEVATGLQVSISRSLILILSNQLSANALRARYANSYSRSHLSEVICQKSNSCAYKGCETFVMS